MIALDSFRPFLRILHIYDSANFQHSDRRIVSRNICHGIAVTTILCCFALAMLGTAWYCVHFAFDLSVVAVQIGLLINANQFAITYISFMLKKHRVDEVFGILAETISKRECCCYDRSKLGDS